MKSMLAFVAGMAAFSAPARAQVIQGESTYEDNFVHTEGDAERAQRAAEREKKGAAEKSETKPTDTPRGSE